jgi:hypothetical protein
MGATMAGSWPIHRAGKPAMFERAVRTLYVEQGRNAPSRAIWTGSPLAVDLASSRRASASEMKSRRIAGILPFNRGGLSIQRRICFSINGPIPRNSVSDRFRAARSVTFSGHKNALRAARRKARESIRVSRSACVASSSAMSMFDSTSENRFRLHLQGRRKTDLRYAGARSFLSMRFNSDA